MPCLTSAISETIFFLKECNLFSPISCLGQKPTCFGLGTLYSKGYCSKITYRVLDARTRLCSTYAGWVPRPNAYGTASLNNLPRYSSFKLRNSASDDQERDHAGRKRNKESSCSVRSYSLGLKFPALPYLAALASPSALDVSDLGRLVWCRSPTLFLRRFRSVVSHIC